MMESYYGESRKQRHVKMKKEYLPDSQKSPYLNEIIVYMKERETQTRHDKFRLSPQKSWRLDLVNWTLTVAAKLKLGNNAVHLAVKLLDGFMGGHDIEAHRLFLVSIGCLRIASKFEEKDSKVPKLKTISSLLPVNLNIRSSEYRCLEEMVLKYFRWNVNIPTASHFLEIFLPFSMANIMEETGFSKTTYGTSQSTKSQAQEKFIGVMSDFLDLSLQENSLMSKLPSQVASAIIYCSRQICRVHPTWSEQLANVTGLLYPHIEDCVADLTKIYNEAFKKKRRITCSDSDEEISTSQRSIAESSIGNKNELLLNDSIPKLDNCCNNASKVPVIDLDEDSSDYNDDTSEITVIDLSKDDGYSSLGACSSTDVHKDEITHNEDNEIFNKIDYMAESMDSKAHDSPRPRKKSRNNIEICSAVSPDYPWYLKTHFFKKNISATKANNYCEGKIFRDNKCRRNLSFDTFESRKAQDQGVINNTNKDRSSALSHELQSKNTSNSEVIIIMEKICKNYNM